MGTRKNRLGHSSPSEQPRHRDGRDADTHGHKVGAHQSIGKNDREN